MNSTRHFTWNAETQTFSAFLSDLPGNPFCRAYPDSCDLGLIVVSEKTGEEAMYVVEREDRDAEGELRFYELRPTPQAARKVPGVRGTKIVLFND